mgnify:CR=1 FL=1
MNDCVQTSKTRKIARAVRDNVIYTVAVCSSTNPLFAFTDTFALGTSNDTSIGTRIDVALFSLLGAGIGFVKGRQASRNLFKVTPMSREKIQALHDFLYTAAFNMAFAPPLYMLNGADAGTAYAGGAIAAGMSLITGPINGYAIDAAGDLTGIRLNPRIPHSLNSLAQSLEKIPLLRPAFEYVADKARNAGEFVGHLSLRGKKSLVALLAAGSLGLTSGVYTLNSYRSDPQETNQPAETKDYR